MSQTRNDGARMRAGPSALSYTSEKAPRVRHAHPGVVVVATRRHTEEALDLVVFRDEVRRRMRMLG